jgi:predicted aspartyl protease
MAKKRKKINVKIKMINIDRKGCHLAVNVKINRKKAFLIIDTGASQTVFDKNRIGEFLGHEQFEKVDSLSSGLGTNTMESHVVKVPKITIGEMELINERIILLDLSHVNQSYSMMKMKLIDGVIGGDMLKKYKAVIDYGKKMIVFNS